MIEILKSGKPLSENEIVHLEKKLGYALPEKYRDFLRFHNGGRPYPERFNFRRDLNGNFIENAIHFFYGLGSTAAHAELVTVSECFKGRIPSELLAIGDDHFGNQICLSIRGDQIGAIFLWDHELEHIPPTYKNVYFLSNSFSEFINNLHEATRDWEAPIAQAIRKDDVTALDKLLGTEVDLEQLDQWSRTLMENATLANSLNVMRYLFLRGANLRNARSLAEGNLILVPDLERAISLLSEMETRQ